MKKDAEFIISIFISKVDEFDPGKTLSDLFFFGVAASVQKVGQIMCAHYPQAMCFYGEEHTLSLFLVTYQKWCNKGMCNVKFNLESIFI